MLLTLHTSFTSRLLFVVSGYSLYAYLSAWNIEARVRSTPAILCRGQRREDCEKKSIITHVFCAVVVQRFTLSTGSQAFRSAREHETMKYYSNSAPALCTKSLHKTKLCRRLLFYTYLLRDLACASRAYAFSRSALASHSGKFSRSK